MPPPSAHLAVPYKDFGRGFYLTSLLPQAKRMAMRVARLREGLEFKKASDQYSFHTQRALAYLKKCGVQYV